MLKPSKMRPIEKKKHQMPSYCMLCPDVATKEVLYELENCVVVQRYCDKCLPHAEYANPQ
jgi:hypothetical protein